MMFAAGLAAMLSLSACADGEEGGDLVDRGQALGRAAARIFEDDGPENERPRLVLPADENRPYPNLASVPGKPARIGARVREGEISTLGRDRDQALDRDSGLRIGRVGAAATGDGRYLGTVVADAIGAFSAEDEQTLRQAAELARRGTMRIRLEGAAQAALAAADRLGKLGVPRARIDLTPAPDRPSGERAVEISVAPGARER